MDSLMSISAMDKVVSLTDKTLRSIGIYNVESAVGITTFIAVLVVFFSFATDFFSALEDIDRKSSKSVKDLHFAAEKWLSFDRSAMKDVIKMW